MKRTLIFSLLALALAMILPGLSALFLPSWAPTVPPESAGEDVPAAEAVFFDIDGSIAVTVLHHGQTLTMTMAEYLPGVLSGEMSPDFAAAALEAQAVAARTYALARRHVSGSHPEAQVCDSAECCQVWLDEAECRARWGESYGENMARMRAAVAATNGEVLTYQGEPIQACFHSSSPGRTESSQALWGTELPYLVSVDSPETGADVPGFVSTRELRPEEFREVILTRYPDSELRTALPPDWLGECREDPGGRVAEIEVGGTAISGTEMRSLFSLRSASFTLVWTGQSFLFTVTGFGHGAGMSQYGANVMAREGADYRTILAHYYPGTTLEKRIG